MKLHPLAIAAVFICVLFLCAFFVSSAHQREMMGLVLSFLLFLYFAYRSFLKTSAADTVNKRIIAMMAIFVLTPLLAFVADMTIPASTELKPVRSTAWLAVLLMYAWMRVIKRNDKPKG